MSLEPVSRRLGWKENCRGIKRPSWRVCALRWWGMSVPHPNWTLKAAAVGTVITEVRHKSQGKEVGEWKTEAMLRGQGKLRDGETASLGANGGPWHSEAKLFPPKCSPWSFLVLFFFVCGFFFQLYHSQTHTLLRLYMADAAQWTKS